MKKRSGILLSCITGSTEICWIYAWISFTMTAIIGHVISLAEMGVIFAFAAILTHVSRGHGWRVVVLIGLHLLGFVFSALYVLHGLFYASYRAVDTEWVTLLFSTSRTPLEWVYLVLALIWVGLIWFGGAAFAKREKTYTATCTRFDIGLAAFFVLLLVKFALRVKGGISTDDQLSSILIYPYLLLSIIAIGVTRIGGDGARHFLPGHGGSGILMSVVSVIVLSASSLIFFLFPILTQIAETGQRVLKNTALWILPAVSGVIRFMFMGGQVRPDPPSGSSPKEGLGFESLSGSSWWAELIEKILRWGIEVVAIMFFAFAIVFLMFLILKWLFSRTAVDPRIIVIQNNSLPWLARLRVFLKALWEALKNVTRGYTKATELFSVLSEWGRRSGLPRLATDTPLEFGARLSHQFPRLKIEIEAITHALSIETYQEKKLTSEQFTDALTAWHTLRSPVYWPRRLKIRLIRKMLPENE